MVLQRKAFIILGFFGWIFVTLLKPGVPSEKTPLHWSEEALALHVVSASPARRINYEALNHWRRLDSMPPVRQIEAIAAHGSYFSRFTTAHELDLFLQSPANLREMDVDPLPILKEFRDRLRLFAHNGFTRKTLPHESMRIISKVTSGDNVARPVTLDAWQMFIRQAWDAKNKQIDPTVEEAVISNLTRIFRTKDDFGHGRENVRISGRATEEQVQALLGIVHIGLREIEEAAKNDAWVLAFAEDNSVARKETASRLARKPPAPKKSPREQAVEIIDDRWKVVVVLRKAWESGVYPQLSWLETNYPEIARLIKKPILFRNGIALARKVAGLPATITPQTVLSAPLIDVTMESVELAIKKAFYRPADPALAKERMLETVA